MSEPFPPGTRVILRGLQAQAQYNGSSGIVLSAVAGRSVVKLRDGQEFSLRPENLEQERDALPAATAAHQIGCRVVLHGLVAHPHYNSRVGIVAKAAHSNSGRCLVKLCNGGEDVTVLSENLRIASDSIWTAVATSADSALEVMLKAVSFLSKFNSTERSDLISKMRKKDKFDFMREDSSMYSFFQECLQGSAQTEEPLEPPHVSAQTLLACSSSKSDAQIMPSFDLDDSVNELPLESTFSFRWSKGQSYCVENEEFDPSGIDEQSDENDDIKDSKSIENAMFGSNPPKIFPVDSSTELGRWELSSRGVAHRLMQKMGFDFSKPCGLGLKHKGPITPVGVNYRPKVGQDTSKNPGLGLAACMQTVASITTNTGSLTSVNRALESVAMNLQKHEPVRVVGRKTARESNEQILVVAEMLKLKEAALSKLGRDAQHHPQQLRHLVTGKIHHAQSEVDDLKRAAEEAMRIAQLKSANKKLKKGKDIF